MCFPEHISVCKTKILGILSSHHPISHITLAQLPERVVNKKKINQKMQEYFATRGLQ